MFNQVSLVHPSYELINTKFCELRLLNDAEGIITALTFISTSRIDLMWKILLMEVCFDFHFPIIHSNGFDVETDLQFKHGYNVTQ